ncbi:MAG TPA: DNA replication/repair protein RecF [Anaerolineaceae bacterium]
MHLTHLSLTNFRAFTRLDMDIPEKALILVGDNAQGKTTILEAIYYLAVFSSFHAQNDRQLINFMAAQETPGVARIIADYLVNTRQSRIEVRLILDSNGNGTSSPRLRKEILVDGVKRSIQEALGSFTAVTFLPQMTRILEDGPEERRRYLNLSISQVFPGYAHALSEYAQALSQRNALLKQISERGTAPDQLDLWDGILAEHGSLIIRARIQAVQELERIAARIHQSLTHQQEVLHIHYLPSFDPLPRPVGQFALQMLTSVDRSAIHPDQIRAGFARRLAELRSEEIARGVTTIGPHRDELRFFGNGTDLGDFGSRGQIRTTLLSLKLAEVAWIKEKTGQLPVLLLDETLVELDQQRRQDLLGYLENYEQSLLTTTDLKLFSPLFVQKSAVWHIANGRVLIPKDSAGGI